MSKNVISLVLACVLLLYSLAGFAAAPLIKHVRIIKAPTTTQVIFDLNRQLPRYKSLLLSKPYRLVLDLPQAHIASLPSVSLFKGSVVKNLRVGHQKNDLRIVLELSHQAKATFYQLPAKGSYGPRFMIRLQHTRLASARPSARSTVSKTPTFRDKNHIKHLRQLVVVIDPGHGGKDPGATGPHRYHEKNVVLAISKKLYSLLKAVPGITPRLTRSGDYYLTLRQRLQVARKDKADIFVAIHADAYRNRYSHGASVFALSNRGASSEAARWLAEKENYSELGGVSLDNKSNMLRSVLLDLSQTATISASLHLGRNLLNQIGRVTHLHHAKVEQARFVVLKSPDIPSVLIETGFISNFREEKNLISPHYQLLLARSIEHGILDYFRQAPIAGTLFKAHNQAISYRVKRGDYLSRIAKRYHLSVAALKQFNHLRTTNIHPGQILQIPVLTS